MLMGKEVKFLSNTIDVRTLKKNQKIDGLPLN